MPKPPKPFSTIFSTKGATPTLSLMLSFLIISPTRSNLMFVIKFDYTVHSDIFGDLFGVKKSWGLNRQGCVLAILEKNPSPTLDR